MFHVTNRRQNILGRKVSRRQNGPSERDLAVSKISKTKFSVKTPIYVVFPIPPVENQSPVISSGEFRTAELCGVKCGVEGDTYSQGEKVMYWVVMR